MDPGEELAHASLRAGEVVQDELQRDDVEADMAFNFQPLKDLGAAKIPDIEGGAVLLSRHVARALRLAPHVLVPPPRLLHGLLREVDADEVFHKHTPEAPRPLVQVLPSAAAEVQHAHRGGHLVDKNLDDEDLHEVVVLPDAGRDVGVLGRFRRWRGDNFRPLGVELLDLVGRIQQAGVVAALRRGLSRAARFGQQSHQGARVPQQILDQQAEAVHMA
mmetsp:Transcript_118769/g.340954  ORF Transcript_118769/g.340954 Transcript_118769/m.340954 type:complete len:218 (+) Transcript_118769:283-936(+)